MRTSRGRKLIDDWTGRSRVEAKFPICFLFRDINLLIYTPRIYIYFLFCTYIWYIYIFVLNIPISLLRMRQNEMKPLTENDQRFIERERERVYASRTTDTFTCFALIMEDLVSFQLIYILLPSILRRRRPCYTHSSHPNLRFYIEAVYVYKFYHKKIWFIHIYFIRKYY